MYQEKSGNPGQELELSGSTVDNHRGRETIEKDPKI
jgi:hypothetical protein